MIKKLLYFLFIPIMGMAQTQIGQDLSGDKPDDKFGFGVAVSADGNVMAISAIENDNNGTDAGHIRVYTKSSGSWVQTGQDIEGNPGDKIGNKIVLSDDGSIIAFSSRSGLRTVNNQNRYGFVSVYKNTNGVWTKIGNDLVGNDAIDGTLAVSLSADGSIVAFSCHTGSIGYNVQIFKNNSGQWNPIGQLHYSSPPNSTIPVTFYFGWSISLSADGSAIAISDVLGYVIICKYQNGNWLPVGNAIVGNLTQEDFGFRVVLSGDGNTVAISARTSDKAGTDSGHVQIYKYNGTSWLQVGNDILGEAAGDVFGQGLVMSENGNVLAVGSYGSDTPNGIDTGKIRIFENIKGNWIEKGSILGTNAGDQIAWSIAMSKDGNSLLIGNPGSNGNALKPKNIPEEQIVEENLLQSGNNQAKGTLGGPAQVFNLSGILSSNTFVLESLKIYPNPTTDFLNIELGNGLILNKVSIYNTNGQLIKQTTKKTINLNGLDKGIYHVQVLTNKGYATQKVIVN